MGHRSGLPDLVAVHGDIVAARHTIERLSLHGVDGGAIELVGRGEVRTAGRAGDRQTDRGSSLAMGGRFVRGWLLGAVAGALFGTVVVALATELTALAFVAGGLGGAAFGAGIGALTALQSTPTMAPSWERTFAPQVPVTEVLVGVHVTDARTAARARRAFRDTEVLRVDEVPDLDDLDLGPPDG